MAARNTWMWHLVNWIGGFTASLIPFVEVKALTMAGANVVQNVATGDIKASAGTVYAVHVEMDGVTAGDSVQIRDDTTVRKTFLAESTDHHLDWVIGLPGAAFATDINIVVAKTSGAVYVTVVYL